MDTNEIPQEQIEETPETPEETTETPETPEEEPTQETPTEEETPEETPETPEGQERQPSRRESLRIQQLLQKMKESKEDTAPKVPDALDYRQALDADPEVISKLEEDRTKFGQTIRDQTLEQVKSIQFHTRLEIDAPRVESKYPALDKSSNDFQPEIADALNTSYLSLVGYDPETDTVKNPNIRYADYIEAQMELAEAIAGQRTQKTAQNIAKQAATTGLRPDGSKAKGLNLNQSPDQMTDEELAAAIAATLPKN